MSITLLRTAVINRLQTAIPGVVIRNRPVGGPLEGVETAVVACVYSVAIREIPDNQDLEEIVVGVRILKPHVSVTAPLDDRQPNELETLAELMQAQLGQIQVLPDGGLGGVTWYLRLSELNFDYVQWCVDATVIGVGWNQFPQAT